MSVDENQRLMTTLDDAWNARDWEIFSKRHAEKVAVYWPGQPDPTRGRHDHLAEAIEFCETFPDNRVENHPYRVLIGQGDWTCMVTTFTGTMKGPMRGADGEIPPTHRSFEVEFCTVAHWMDGEIVEEKLFFDHGELMRQIGLTE